MPEFFSISSYPGKTGTRFYGHFFKKCGLPNHSYTAVGTSDLSSTMATLMENKNIRGISISMPFKKEVIRYLDSHDQIVNEHQCCNTILVDRGMLVGYNCDHAGAKWISTLIAPGERVSIIGSGAMAKMIRSLLPNTSVTMFSRSNGNWEGRHVPADVVINASGAGTSDQSLPLDTLQETRLVVDLAMRNDNFKRLSIESGIPYFGGVEFYIHQFMRQFYVYTGVDLDHDDVRRFSKEFME